MKKNYFNKGINLIEVLIVVAIIGILIAVIIPQFGSFKILQSLQNSTIDVYSAINKARTDTIASVDSKQYGVHFETNQVIIFEGTSYSAGAGSNVINIISSPTSISGISLSGGGSDMYFSRIYGVPNKTGTITLSAGNYTKIITISATGNISAN